MEETPQVYWELIQHDGTVIEIPPDAVPTVKRRWDAGQPIHTKYQGSIPANQIKSFRPTEKPFGAVPLLDEVARAFGEPVVNEDGSIGCKWVKKTVTQAKWDKHYAPLNYRKLREEHGMVVIAMFLPIHQIDVNNTPYCTEEEVNQLKRNH